MHNDHPAIGAATSPGPFVLSLELAEVGIADYA